MRIFLESQIPLGFKGVYPDFTKQFHNLTYISSQLNINFIRRETNLVMQSLNSCLQICQKTKQDIQDRKNGNDMNENQSCQYLLANGKKIYAPYARGISPKIGR